MNSLIYHPALYNFLRFIEWHDTEKTVLDCGAGGRKPPLGLFYTLGFQTSGIDFDEKMINYAKAFESEHNFQLNIINADMRDIPFDDESFGNVFSYNTIFHMSKQDIQKSLEEMKRVLKKGGLMYINFICIDLSNNRYLGEEREPGEFWMEHDGEEILHTGFKQAETDEYFNDMEIIYKEKKHFYIKYPQGFESDQAYHEYILKKL